MKKRKVFKSSPVSAVSTALVPYGLTVAVIIMAAFGFNRAELAGRDEGRRVLEDSLRRAVAACYATEGRYPENVAYLEEYYGVYVDRTQYAVHYEVFASNLLPELTVMLR